MKKVLLGVIGIMMSAIVVLFVMQESKSSITAPTIKTADEGEPAVAATAAYMNGIKKPYRLKAPSRKSNKVAKPKRHVRSKAKPKAVSASMEDKRPSVPVVKVAALPTLEDRQKGRWIENLSGEQVDLNIKRAEVLEQDCTKQACDRTNSYSIVGVVVETRRFNQDKEQILDGDVALGDSHDKPLVYVK